MSQRRSRRSFEILNLESLSTFSENVCVPGHFIVFVNSFKQNRSYTENMCDPIIVMVSQIFSKI